MIFRDRPDAARLLAEKLEAYRDQPGVLVLGLPRGGVPMARIVADALSAPVDILLVRKLGVPSQPELAFGAIAEGGVQVLDPAAIEQCRVHPRDVEHTIAREQKEIARRAILFRGAHRPPNVQGRDVIVVDDGLATGSTMLAAVRALRIQKPHRIVVAVPVGSGEGLPPRAGCGRRSGVPLDSRVLRGRRQLVLRFRAGYRRRSKGRSSRPRRASITAEAAGRQNPEPSSRGSSGWGRLQPAAGLQTRQCAI